MSVTGERIVADCSQCKAKAILPPEWRQIRHQPDCPLVDPTQPFRTVLT